ncbi:hypothetical protein BURPS668_A0391 [Burkholderia pseudomallei 668]|nr:hypothetical protein BURPS668_A0391 [Burkholderia pseudomallei 668]
MHPRTHARAHWGARRRPRCRAAAPPRRTPNAERRTAAEPLRRVRDRSSPPLKCR